MQSLADQLALERLGREEERCELEVLRRGGRQDSVLALQGRGVDESTPRGKRVSDGASDSGFESDAASSIAGDDTASLTSASSSTFSSTSAAPFSPTTPLSPRSTYLSLHLQHQISNDQQTYSTPPSPTKAWRSTAAVEGQQQQAQRSGHGGLLPLYTSGGPSNGAWNVVSDLRRQNAGLRGRVRELEAAVEGCLGIVGQGGLV